MTILIACEESQTLCRAFRAAGHDAYSCDLVDCSGGHPEWHIKDDALKVMEGWVRVIHADECLFEEWDEDRECPTCPLCLAPYGECLHPGPTMEVDYDEFDGVLYAKAFQWDMMIAHPDCSDLALSGAKHFAKKRQDGRQQAAIDNFMKYVNAPIPKKCIENPMTIMSRLYRRPDQIINPFDFGDAAQKKTCLWLTGLPKLKATTMDAPLFGLSIDRGEVSKYGKQNSMAKWINLPPSPERKRIRSKTFQGIATAMALQWG